jgi:quercetin dioxygenase-like cupin family protein
VRAFWLEMWFAGGGAFTWKATAAETGGAFLLLEDRMQRGKTTPQHVHPNEDEAIYVLEGELLVDVEGEQHHVGPGGFLFAPRGVPHAFMVTSETARVLSLQTPGTGEAFYRDAGEPVRSLADASRPADWARLRAVAERFGEHRAGRSAAVRHPATGRCSSRVLALRVVGLKRFEAKKRQQRFRRVSTG